MFGVPKVRLVESFRLPYIFRLSTTIRSEPEVRRGVRICPHPPAWRVRPNTPAGRGLTFDLCYMQEQHYILCDWNLANINLGMFFPNHLVLKLNKIVYEPHFFANYAALFLKETVHLRKLRFFKKF